MLKAFILDWHRKLRHEHPRLLASIKVGNSSLASERYSIVIMDAAGRTMTIIFDRDAAQSVGETLCNLVRVNARSSAA